MKTALIVTLGSRDMQLNASFIDNQELNKLEIDLAPVNNSSKYSTLNKPRSDGSKIFNNFNIFEKHIQFPIIIPAIDYILGGYRTIDKVIMAVTNQNDPSFNKRDTLYFGYILEKYLKTNYLGLITEIQSIVFKDRILDYDYIYKFCGGQLKRTLFESDNWTVFLLPQGGIDSINTALLLRCIEHFDNFYQLSKPEGADSITKQSFPSSFRQMLEKQRILQSVNNFNYAALINFKSGDSCITTLATYAYYRLGLDYEIAWKAIHEFDTGNMSNDKKEFFESLLADVAMKKGVHDILKLQSDLYLFVKMRWKQGYYADFLMRLFALSENLLIPLISNHFNILIKYNESDEHKDWKKFINSNPNLEAFLKKQRFYGKSVDYNYPNRFAYISIYKYMVETSIIDSNSIISDNTFLTLNTLASLRNKIAHGLHSISSDVILRELNNRNQDIDKLFDDMDKYFGIEGLDDFGVYSRINERIIKLLN